MEKIIKAKDALDARWEAGELAIAAACYAVEGIHKISVTKPVLIENRNETIIRESHVDAWPWDHSWDKRGKHDRLRRLAIAGALIAAEIDRLQAEKEGES